MNRNVFLAALIAFLGILGLAGCGGSGSSDETGTLTLAVTDSPAEDLETFQVDLKSVQLYLESGAAVTLLDSPIRIDFTVLSDLSEVLRFVEVPAGLYTGGNMTFDWSAAVARIAGKSADALILDSSGSPLTGNSTLELTFPSGSCSIPANRHRLLEFDFDLDSSVEVDPPQNRVTVAPTVVLRVDRNDPKPLITGGRLLSVDVASSSFVTTIQRPQGASIGTVTCAALGSTIFQVNGVPSLGATGIKALSLLPVDTWVQTYGVLNPGDPTFYVLYVEAGAGTIGGGADVVEGVVTARTGGPQSDPTIMVLGHSLSSKGSSVNLNTSFAVKLDLGTTRVVRLGSLTLYTTNDINVGQAVRVYGKLTGFTLDASGPGSVARLQPTRIFGFANGPASAGTISLDLSRISQRSADLFDFTVSGVEQADPDNLIVDIGGLSAETVKQDTALEFFGFFPSVNSPGADFLATALTNRDTAYSWLRLRYEPPSSTALASVAADGIEFDLAGSAKAVIDRGFVGDENLPSSPAPKVVPAAGGLRIYTIVEGFSVSIHGAFADFAGDLEARRSAGSKLHAFRAIGKYTALDNTLAANTAVAVLEKP